jgi:hypothetical protein
MSIFIFNEKTCDELAKILTAMCVRNAEIENNHVGQNIATKTGDYSDGKVIDAEDNDFAWPEINGKLNVYHNKEF